MKKFTGKFEKLHEETLYRHQQNGFLRGDYVRIKKGSLNGKSIDGLSDQMKTQFQEAIQNDTVLRVSYIKSGRSEAFSGPVDAANIPACELWADCYVEHAPGMWHNVMTIPLSILEKIEVEGMNGFPQYNQDLVRPNAEDPGKPCKVMKAQTKGDDENRKLTRKNTKLANTKQPTDGQSKTKFKESVGFTKKNKLIFEGYNKKMNRNAVGFRKENELMFENYLKEEYAPDDQTDISSKLDTDPYQYIQKTLGPNNSFEFFKQRMKTDGAFFDAVYNVIFDHEDENTAYNIWDSGLEGQYDYIQGVIEGGDTNYSEVTEDMEDTQFQTNTEYIRRAVINLGEGQSDILRPGLPGDVKDPNAVIEQLNSLISEFLAAVEPLL